MNKPFLALALTAAVLTACNNAPEANDSKAEADNTNTVTIAYVEVDSIMTQYTFAKETSEILQKKAENIQNTLTAKQQAIQAATAKLEQDYQNNNLTQSQAQQRQQAIQNDYNNLQVLNQRLTSEFNAEQEKFSIALQDSIHHYLTAYNKDKGYTMILSKSGDNILMADPSLDITDEIIAGLNKAYKAGQAKKDSKEAEKASEKK